MKGKQKQKKEYKANREPKLEREKINKYKYSKYKPKWTRTEIYNEELGIDMIINIQLHFRTG